MAEAASKVPVKTEQKAAECGRVASVATVRDLRREVDRLFEDFDEINAF